MNESQNIPIENENLADLTIGSIDFTADDRDEKLTNCGFLDAGRNHGDIEPVYNNLEQIEAKAWQVLATPIVKSENDAPNINIEEEVSEIDNKIKRNNEKREKIENEIEELRIKKDTLKSYEHVLDKPFSALNYYVFLIVLLLLTGYLIVFYVSAGYTAIFSKFEITQDMTKDEVFELLFTSVIDPKVFNKLEGSGLFLILFPFIFVGLGLLIHKFIENKQYFRLILLLAFNFFVDFLLAISIEKKVSNLMISMDITPAPFYFNVNFYMVLALGFGAYIVWGFLYHFFMLEHEKKQPDKERDKKIKKIEIHMQEKQQEVQIIENEITMLKEKRRQITEITKKQKDEIKLQLDKELLEALLRAYTQGYTNWLNQMGIGTKEAFDQIEEYIHRILKKGQENETR
ncbi:MAG: hypothetical protein N2450_06410 [bacterium]|nr:hypothetical protein [bacterium]